MIEHAIQPFKKNPFAELGSSIFEEFARSESAIYVDKTLFIKAVVNSRKVTLVTRPRRWGKTLNMTMLDYFYSIPVQKDATIDEDKLRQKYEIFSRMAIGSEKIIMDEYCGKYPTIFISFTSTKTSTIENLIERLAELVYMCYNKHIYLLDSIKLNATDKERFNKYIAKTASRSELENSLFHLSEMLHKHFDKQVIILIDEYDTPLNDWYVRALSKEEGNIENADYFQGALAIFRNMFEAALKNNPYLEKSVVTGILRVAKASLFSGLNNFGEDSILDKRYAKYFGFLEEEVAYLLHKAGMDKKQEIVDNLKSWYNGYNIGGVTIYNPWSIMSYIYEEGELGAYWVGSASLAVIEKTLILDKFQEEMQQLINGQSVHMIADPKMAFAEINSSVEAFYNLLLFSGYLTAESAERNDDGVTYNCSVKIPNKEVRGVFTGSLQKWLAHKLGIAPDIYREFIGNLLRGNIEIFVQQLKNYLEFSASFDSTGTKNAEVFYNGLMLGLIASISNKYFVETEKESGDGRADLMLIPKENAQHRNAIVIEFKSSRKEDDLQKAAASALEQIKNKNYVSKIKAHDNVSRIISVGLAFCGKDVEVAFLE